jgi:putative iron-only hydrogenase system regulator
MKRIAVISAVLESPEESQTLFNEIVSSFQHIIKGRMGIPFSEEHIAVISLTVSGTLDEINALTGTLGKLPNVSVKTAVSKKEC